ncbi:hypothetical protein SSCG_04905 [Streptomyces clavuligerus]|nr:hypothetical protein SSCG_04905 [Streptomyces clavuligerus]
MTPFRCVSFVTFEASPCSGPLGDRPARGARSAGSVRRGRDLRRAGAGRKSAVLAGFRFLGCCCEALILEDPGRTARGLDLAGVAALAAPRPEPAPGAGPGHGRRAGARAGRDDPDGLPGEDARRGDRPGRRVRRRRRGADAAAAPVPRSRADRELRPRRGLRRHDPRGDPGGLVRGSEGGGPGAGGPRVLRRVRGGHGRHGRHGRRRPGDAAVHPEHPAAVAALLPGDGGRPRPGRTVLGPAADTAARPSGAQRQAAVGTPDDRRSGTAQGAPAHRPGHARQPRATSSR